jgi:hypothetical protein
MLGHSLDITDAARPPRQRLSSPVAALDKTGRAEHPSHRSDAEVTEPEAKAPQNGQWLPRQPALDW